MARTDSNSVSLSEIDQSLRGRGGLGERLLDIRVALGAKHALGERFVRMRRSADVHDVHLATGEQLVEPLEDSRFWRDTPDRIVHVERGIGDCNDVRPIRDATDGGSVVAAHGATTDDGDAERGARWRTKRI